MLKAEELKILEQIEKLIDHAGADSYIRMTFAGVPEVCKRNIEDDFGDSPVQDWEEMRNMLCAERVAHDETKRLLAEAQGKLKEAIRDAEGMQERIKELEQAKKDAREYRASAESVIDNMEEEITEWKNKFSDAVSLADEWENNAHDMANQLSQKDAEILRLKAELYDYMRKERDLHD